MRGSRTARDDVIGAIEVRHRGGSPRDPSGGWGPASPNRPAGPTLTLMADPVALTIGNFDGVHRGHVALLHAARERLGPGGRVVVVTFDPHPAVVLRPRSAPARLGTTDQRRRWLLAAGADEVEVLPATPELLERSADRFLGDLVSRLNPTLVVEGPDFRFGRARAGTVETLRDAGARGGFEVLILDPVTVALADQTVVAVSSSMIRWLVEHGRVEDAGTGLGRAYELEATVVRGDQRGRRIGFPTINLRHGDLLLPRDGVYAGRAQRPDGRMYQAAISVGTKPTFGRSERVAEAYLIEYDGPVDDYDWTVRLRVEHWLRDQLTYPSLPPLLEQLDRDVERTRALVPLETACARS